MKKVLISLAVLQSALVASTALAADTYVIHIQGAVVNGSCITSTPEKAANRMDLSYCAGSVPQVVLLTDKATPERLQASKPYNIAAPEQAFDSNEFFNISYTAAQAPEAGSVMNYLINYN